MKTINVHIGHFLMTFAVVMFMASFALFANDVTFADAVRVIMSSIGTLVILAMLATFEKA